MFDADRGGVAFKRIADAIGRGLQVPVVGQTPEQAAEHFAFFAHFAALDAPASSRKTREFLDWRPKHLGLIADMDEPYYFRK